MTNLSHIDLGRMIRARREHLKMSRETLAAKAGYSVTVVQRAELGKGKRVSAQTLADLAQAVELSAAAVKP